MDNKLQALTDKLYNEGLSKGKQEAEVLIAKARSQAEDIVAEAQEQALEIVAKAQKEAAALQAKTAGDLRMASNQGITATKQYVEQMILTKAVADSSAKALSDAAFIKELIKTIVGAFNAANPESVPLAVILPEPLKKELDGALEAEIRKQLNAGLEIKYAKGMANGFKIGPADGSYRISFTAEDFSRLIGGYLRPATRKILFGE